jgi:hypothetical protein
MHAPCRELKRLRKSLESQKEAAAAAEREQRLALAGAFVVVLSVSTCSVAVAVWQFFVEGTSFRKLAWEGGGGRGLA